MWNYIKSLVTPSTKKQKKNHTVTDPQQTVKTPTQSKSTPSPVKSSTKGQKKQNHTGTDKQQAAKTPTQSKSIPSQVKSSTKGQKKQNHTVTDKQQAAKTSTQSPSKGQEQQNHTDTTTINIKSIPSKSNASRKLYDEQKQQLKNTLKHFIMNNDIAKTNIKHIENFSQKEVENLVKFYEKLCDEKQDEVFVNKVDQKLLQKLYKGYKNIQSNKPATPERSISSHPSPRTRTRTRTRTHTTTNKNIENMLEKKIKSGPPPQPKYYPLYEGWSTHKKQSAKELEDLIHSILIQPTKSLKKLDINASPYVPPPPSKVK